MPFTIEMLMTIAAAGALLIGAAEEAALVVFLFAVGEVLEGVAANRARASIRALGDLVPKTALVVEASGTTRKIDAAASRSVRPCWSGRVTGCRPTETIIEGISGIDESPVTGESVPSTKGPGEPVFAGSINAEAALARARHKAAEDNTIARIIRLVEEAQEARAPTERFIDRFSRWYMPAIVGLAILVAILPPLLFAEPWETWIYRALALLLIGCPCALVISVPASIASGAVGGCAARASDEGRRRHRGRRADRGRHLRQDRDADRRASRRSPTSWRSPGARRTCWRWRPASRPAPSHPLAEAVLREAREAGGSGRRR